MVLRRLSFEVEFTLVDKSDEQYSDILKRYEIPQGIIISVIFYVTNVNTPIFYLYRKNFYYIDRT